MSRLKVVIPRKEWTGNSDSRRENRPSSLCRNVSGERCCIGHYLLAYNPQFKIFSASKFFPMPQDLNSGIPDYVPSWLLEEVRAEDDEFGVYEPDEPRVVLTNSPVASLLAHLNDMVVDVSDYAVYMPQDLKEAGIMYVFDMYDVDVEFVD